MKKISRDLRNALTDSYNFRCTRTLPRCVCCLSLSSICVLCCCCRRCVWRAWGLWGRGSERVLLRGLCDWTPPGDRWSNCGANCSGTESRPGTAKRREEKGDIYTCEHQHACSNKMIWITQVRWRKVKSLKWEGKRTKGGLKMMVSESNKVYSICNHWVVLYHFIQYLTTVNTLDVFTLQLCGFFLKWQINHTTLNWVSASVFKSELWRFCPDAVHVCMCAQSVCLTGE